MKRVLSVFLALMMVVGCMTIMPLNIIASNEQVSVWDGTSSTKPEGTGTKESPYIIDSAADLQWIATIDGTSGSGSIERLGYNGLVYAPKYYSDAELKTQLTDVNNADQIQYINFDEKLYVTSGDGKIDTSSATMDWTEKIYVKQVCHIDLGGHALHAIGDYWAGGVFVSSATAEGTAVNNKGNYFCGEYDGGGYKIMNGSITGGTNNNWPVSLFGHIWNTTIKDLTLDGITAGNASFGGVVVARSIGAGVLGTYGLADLADEENVNLIQNVHVTSTCSFVAGPSNTDAYKNGLGGIIGTAENITIENCSSAATVTATKNAPYMGGIAGYANNATIRNCSVVAHVNPSDNTNRLGGIVGQALNNCEITGCTVEGTLTGGAATALMGGVVGDLNAGTVRDCTVNVTVNAGAVTTHAAGIAAYAPSSTVSGCTVVGTVVGGAKALYLGGVVGQISGVGAKVEKCVSYANVKTSLTTEHYMGGIVGEMEKGPSIDGCIFKGSLAHTAKLSGEVHVGGILGSWRAGNTTTDYGDCRISNCINFGGYSSAGTGGTLCIGGILGATSNLYIKAATETTTGTSYGIENCINIGMDNEGNKFNAIRAAGIAGCVFNSAMGDKATQEANFGQFLFKNCETVEFKIVKPSGTDYLTSECGMVGAYRNRNYGEAVVTEENCSVSTISNIRCGDLYDALTYGDENFDGFYQILWVGDGSRNNPYQIDSYEDLAWMRVFLGYSETPQYDHYDGYQGKFFVQTCDIDLGGKALSPIGYYFRDTGATDNSMDGHKVTGNVRNEKSVAFRGTYDGQGYAIKNGKINGMPNTNTYWASGLFGCIYGATLKNIVMDNVSVSGGGQVGVLVGMAVHPLYSDKKLADAGYKVIVDDEAMTWTGNFNDYANKAEYAAEEDPDFNVIEGCIVKDTCSVVSTYTSTSNEYETLQAGRIGGIIASATCATIKGCYSGAKVNANYKSAVKTTDGEKADDGSYEKTVVDEYGVKTVYTVASDTTETWKSTTYANRVNAAGGIAGTAGFGTVIDSCISGATISYDFGTGCNLAESGFGGIVGCLAPNGNHATKGSLVIENCLNIGSFTSAGSNLRGSYYYGGIIGGLYRVTTGNITNCYNLGSVSVASPTTIAEGKNWRIGGILGSAWQDKNNANCDTVVLENCYSANFGVASGVSYSNEFHTKSGTASKINAINYQTNASNGTFPVTYDFYIDANQNGVRDDDEEIKTLVSATTLSLANFRPVSIGIDDAKAAAGAAAVKNAFVDAQADSAASMKFFGAQTQSTSANDFSLRLVFALDADVFHALYKEVSFDVSLGGNDLVQNVTQNTVYESFRNYKYENGAMVQWTEDMDGYQPDESGYAYELWTAADEDPQYRYMTALTINNVPKTGTYSLTVNASLVRQDYNLATGEFANGGDTGVAIGENKACPVTVTIVNGEVTSMTYDVADIG